MADALPPIHDRVRAILQDPAYDDEDSELTHPEAVYALVQVYGWEPVLEEMLRILEDDAAHRHWYTASAVLWSGVERPMPSDRVIALLYLRLEEDVPEPLDDNLVWSITHNLKRVGYLSEYDPYKDEAVDAEKRRLRDLLAARRKGA